jgi:hypothetical protein
MLHDMQLWSCGRNPPFLPHRQETNQREHYLHPASLFVIYLIRTAVENLESSEES